MEQQAVFVESIASDTSLFLCDLQQEYSHKISNFEEVVNNSIKMLKAGLNLGLSISLTELEGFGHLVPDIEEHYPEFEQNLEGKIRFSICSTKMMDSLQEKSCVLLCGFQAHEAIKECATHLMRAGLSVVVVTDACSSTCFGDRDKAYELLEEEGCHLMTTATAIESIKTRPTVRHRHTHGHGHEALEGAAAKKEPGQEIKSAKKKSSSSKTDESGKASKDHKQISTGKGRRSGAAASHAKSTWKGKLAQHPSDHQGGGDDSSGSNEPEAKTEIEPRSSRSNVGKESSSSSFVIRSRSRHQGKQSKGKSRGNEGRRSTARFFKEAPQVHVDPEFREDRDRSCSPSGGNAENHQGPSWVRSDIFSRREKSKNPERSTFSGDKDSESPWGKSRDKDYDDPWGKSRDKDYDDPWGKSSSSRARDKNFESSWRRRTFSDADNQESPWGRTASSRDKNLRSAWASSSSSRDKNLEKSCTVM